MNSVAFDPSGVFLAVGGGAADGGASLHVRVVKDWAECADLSGAHSRAVTGLAWRGDSGSLVTGAMDRCIKVFASPAL